MQILPLSKAQQRVWFEWKAIPASAAYNNPLFYHLCGDVKPELITQALQHVVDTQPALRCYFLEHGGIPKQVLLPNVTVNLDYHDLTNVALQDKNVIAQRIIANNTEEGFALDQLPLFRFTLIRIAEYEYYFILNIHHIVVDGHSAGLLIRMISDYYNQQQLNTDKHDDGYIRHLTQASASQQAEYEFWVKQFKEANFTIDLYAEPNGSHVNQDQGQRKHFTISPELSQQLKKLAKSHKTTDFIVLMAAFYVVLAKYANQYDLSIGYAVDTRTADQKKLFGFFVNHVPLRLAFSPTHTFQEVVEALTYQRKAIKPYQTQDYIDIIKAVRQAYPSTPSALSNVSFIRANFALSGLDLHGINVKPIPIFTGAVKDDLCLLYDEAVGFEFEIEYRKNKYHPDYITAIEESYQQCLAEISNHPAIKIADLNIFKQQIPAAVVCENLNENDTLVQRFIQHAAHHPNKTAIITNEQCISYDELYLRVTMLVACFSEQHLTRENTVIVYLDRTPSLLATLLALQWLGIPYIPLDMNTPIDRLMTIMEESQAAAVITNTEKTLSACRMIKPTECSQSNLSIPAPETGQLAYIIYTSGSTGKPKGVSVSCRALYQFLSSMEKKFTKSADDLLLAITTVAFDISGLELFLPIWSGTALYLSNQKQHKDPFAIKTILTEQPVTLLQATPAMWNMLLEVEWLGKQNLTALCGGEALSRSLADRLLPKVDTLWNMYGPTEATIWCSYKQINADEPITVGSPIANMKMYVLDEQLNLLPPYVKGDLYIAGIGLAEGYLNRPDLSAQQFIIHPRLNTRIYRTGDIACMNHKGEFIIFGRQDNQIKLHGYRIELGEIEANLAAIDGISQAAVIIHEHQLIAYLVANQPILSEMIHAQLAQKIPDYMLPKRYVFLDVLPLSNSGKVDRNALPRTFAEVPAMIEPPANELEEKLLAVWTQILNQHSISVTDHFYDCGGHSLLATQIIARLMNEYGIHLELREFFHYPSIRQCALYLENANQVMISIPKTHLLHYPLTDAQQRFWFLSQISQDVGQFNMAASIHVSGAFDHQQWCDAFKRLCHQHPILRSVITLVDEMPMQSIIPDQEWPVTFVESDTLHDEPLNYLALWARQPFQLTHSLLWRACVIQINPEQYYLGLCLHHIICDGASVPILLRDLFAAYQQQDMAEAETTYFDHAAWECSVDLDMNKLAFWQQVLTGCSYLQLPSDFKRSLHYDYKGKQQSWMMPASIWQSIRLFCQAEQVSVSSYCIAVFALFLQRVCKLNDFCIGLPLANRNHPALIDMVGCFINLLPLRISIPSHVSFRAWMQQLHAHIQEILSNQNVSFTKLLEQLHVERHANQSPLFSVIMNIQPFPFEELAVSGLELTIQPLHTLTSKYDLSMDLYFTDDVLYGSCEFAISLFKDQTITHWCNQYQSMLGEFILAPDTLLISEHVSVTSTKENNYFPQPLTTPLQFQIADLWKHHLKVKEIHKQDNFFALGGHSLLAARLITSISKALAFSVPLETLFMHPVFEQFCTAVSSLQIQCATDIQAISIKNNGSIQLTPNQQQLALLYQEEKNDMYHLGVMVECPADCTFSKLEAAIQRVLSHQTIYRWQLNKNNKLAEFIHEVTPEIHIISTVHHQHSMDEARKWLSRVFDLSQAPLVRFVFIQEETGKNYLFVCMHHIIGDEWSLELLVTSILHGTSDAQHHRWQDYYMRWLDDQAESIDYWKTYLAGSHATLIPYSKSCHSHLGAVKRDGSLLTDAILKQCQMISEKYAVSIYLVMLAAYCVLIKYFSGENRIYFATAYDRRKTAELQNLHGYVVNIIPVQVDFNQIDTLHDLILKLNQDRINSIQHADIDFAQLVADGIAAKPHIVFNYQHTYQITNAQGEVLNWQEIIGHQAKFPFILQLRQMADGKVECVIEYADHCYDESFTQQALSAYQHILALLPENMNLKLTDWKLTPHPIMASSDYVPALSHHQSFISMLRMITLAHSHRLAIEYADRRLSYGELWNNVYQVASALAACHPGSFENKVIAVALPNSDDYVITILAILSLGAAFVSIDTHYPMERQQQMIQDSEAIMVITEEEKTVHANAVSFSSLICANLLIKDCCLNSDKGAYIIYTSGTTGKPKGVLIKQNQLHHFIDALQKKLCITQEDKVLQFASISFDASIWEIFIALYSAATLCIPNKKERMAGTQLQVFMQKHNITHALLTPSVLQTLDPSCLPVLRSLASGGEACTPGLVERWGNRREFFNAYGPTEATVCTNLKKMSHDTKATIIGEPLGDSCLLVVSDTQQSLPAGAIGELYVAGENITHGYINQSWLNADRFVNLSGRRWYKTGDCVRMISDSQFEYLGRKDRQVKLRGLRIELSEIESVLQRYTAVQQAVCQILDNQLVAYVVSHKQMDIVGLQAFISHKLPTFMLPNQIMQIESIPLLPSGKIDSSALPIPRNEASVFISPRDQVESIIYAVWKNYLGRDHFSVNQDFFALGGNSLQVMQIIAEMETHFCIDIAIEVFYSHSTIEKQAKLIQEMKSVKKDSLEDMINQLSIDEQMELLNLAR